MFSITFVNYRIGWHKERRTMGSTGRRLGGSARSISHCDWLHHGTFKTFVLNPTLRDRAGKKRCTYGIIVSLLDI